MFECSDIWKLKYFNIVCIFTNKNEDVLNFVRMSEFCSKIEILTVLRLKVLNMIFYTHVIFVLGYVEKDFEYTKTEGKISEDACYKFMSRLNKKRLNSQPANIEFKKSKADG